VCDFAPVIAPLCLHFEHIYLLSFALWMRFPI